MVGVHARFFTIFAVAVFAWALLFAGMAAAQEDTTEDTTVLSADAANHRVEAKTSNVSVEVDNGEVSVSTDDGSSSDDGTSQQSSLTVQQNQTDEGSQSQVSTGDVNIGATRTSNNFTIVVTKHSDGTQVKRVSTQRDATNKSFIVNKEADNYKLAVTVHPESGTTFSITIDECRGASTTTCQKPKQLARITNPDKSAPFKTTVNKFRVTYTVNFKNSNNGGGGGGGGGGGSPINAAQNPTNPTN